MSLFSEETLSHYGIQGQKKGIRRWQYPDGRFNEEGKIRYFGQSKELHNGIFTKYFNKNGSLNEDGKKKYEHEIKRLEKKMGERGVDDYVTSYNKMARLMNSKVIPEYNKKYGSESKKYNKDKYFDNYEILSENVRRAFYYGDIYKKALNNPAYKKIKSLIEKYQDEVKSEYVEEFKRGDKNLKKISEEADKLYVYSGEKIIKDYLEKYI